MGIRKVEFFSAKLHLLLRRTTSRTLLANPLLERKQLFRPECLVVDLRSRFDQILQVRPREEIAKVDKLAMGFVFYIDYTPAVLPTPHRFPINDNIVFRTDNSKRNDLLKI